MATRAKADIDIVDLGIEMIPVPRKTKNYW